MWCAPDAVAMLHGNTSATRHFVSGCTKPDLTALKLTMAHDDGIVTFLNVGANKGYEIAHFLEVFAPERNTSGQQWHAAIREHASEKRSGYLRYSSLGACSDGKQKRASRGRNVVLGHRAVHVHAFEMMASTATMLSSVVNASGVSDMVSIHNVAVSNATDAVHIPGSGKMGDERNAICHLGGPGRWRLRDTACGWRGSRLVPSISLDDFLDRQRLHGLIFQVTIDTEGWDSFVIDGLQRTLRSRRIRLLEFEYTALGMWPRFSLEGVIKRLSSEEAGGYQCFWQGKSLLPASPPCWQPSFEIGRWSNLICATEPAVIAGLTALAQVGYERRTTRTSTARIASAGKRLQRAQSARHSTSNQRSWQAVAGRS